MYKTTINGQEFEIDFAYFNAGKRLTVWTWQDASDDEWGRHQYIKVYEALHPLQTEFEAFYSWCGDHFGEDVDAEKLAFKMGMELRSSDDVRCIKCEAWYHYQSEDLVHGTDARQDVADSLELGNWDYVCMDCYLTALAAIDKNPVVVI